MIKYFLHNNEQVKSISDGLIKFDKNLFKLEKINITDDEFSKIEQGYKIIVKDKKIKLEKSEMIKEKEKKEYIKTLKNKELSNKEIQEVLNYLI